MDLTETNLKLEKSDKRPLNAVFGGNVLHCCHAAALLLKSNGGNNEKYGNTANQDGDPIGQLRADEVNPVLDYSRRPFGDVFWKN